MNLLQINASARLHDAHSTDLAQRISARISSRYPDAQLTVRDLAKNPQPMLDDFALGALFTPADQRSPEQSMRLALDEALITELQAADTIVIGVPMYNFGISAQLKAWIDAVTKAGVTFRYTENGPEGLLTGKKVYLAFARGGKYRDTPADSQWPYLRHILGFMGLTDVQCVFAEGLAMGEEAVRQALAEAEQQIAELKI